MSSNSLIYQIQGGLSKEQIEIVHQAALSLVERLGISAPHAGILELLTGRAGVSIEGNTVRFAPDLVEQALGAMDYPDWLKTLQWGIISGAYSQNVLDSQRDEIRLATQADLVELTRLCDASGFMGSAPVLPHDVENSELREILLYKISYENSTRKSSDLLDSNPKSSPAVAETVYEMACTVGRFFSVGVMVISPFRLIDSELEIIYRFLDRKVPMLVTALPIAGATAPYPLLGAHVQSLAEVMAAVTLLTQISRGGPVYASPIDSIRAHPFDMKKASFVYGSPEDLLGSLLQCQLNRRYGIPVVAKSLLTNAKAPDVQAAAEKAAHTLAAALAGARIFTNAGLLAVDEIFSAEQAVLDAEIVQYVRRLTEGIEISPEALGVEAILETGIGGNFLVHPTTLARYKTSAWVPELFEHTMLSQWASRGASSLREKARSLVQERLRTRPFTLAPEINAELEQIWQAACRQLG